MNPEDLRTWLKIAQDRIESVHSSEIWQEIASHSRPDMMTDLADALHYLTEALWKYEEAIEPQADYPVPSFEDLFPETSFLSCVEVLELPQPIIPVEEQQCN